MKKLKIFLFCVFVLIVSALGSCSEKDNVESRLSYLYENNVFDFVLTVGDYKYDMHMSAEELNGEYPYRDGEMKAVSGLLDGMVFKMKDGVLSIGDGFVLSEEYTPILYMTFAAFAIEQNSFVSSSGDSAVFDGKYKFELFYEDGNVSRIVVSNSDTSCSLDLSRRESER